MRAVSVRAGSTLLAIVVIVVAVSVFHGRGLMPGQTFLPVDLANNLKPWVVEPRPLQNPLIGDPLYQFYPFLSYGVYSIKHGSWPLWNPNIIMGQPIMADPVMQAFYPFFLLPGLVFGAARGLAIGLWLHVLLACYLMYALLRVLGCSRPSAIVGALTYALSGYLVTWLETTFWTATLAWLPGILLGFELVMRRRRVRYLAPPAVALCLAILGGQVSFVMTFSLFFGLYALGRAAHMVWTRQAGAGWPVLTLVVTLGLGVLLACVLLVPFAEFLDRSQRVRETGLFDPTTLESLLTMIVGNFYGNPAATYGGHFWGRGNYAEYTVYAGAVALLLAIAGALSSRKFIVWYLMLLGAVMVYFAVSGPGVQLFNRVPLFKYTSLHRSVFILPLIIAMLAALGLNGPSIKPQAVVLILGRFAGAIYLAWTRDFWGTRAHWAALRLPLWQMAAFCGLATGLVCLRHWLPATKPYVEWSFVVLVFADLNLSSSHFNPVGPISELFPTTPGLEYLQEHAGIQRVAACAAFESPFMSPNLLPLFGLADAEGYSSVLPGNYARLIAKGDPKLAATYMKDNPNLAVCVQPSARLLDLLGAGYIVTSEKLPDSQIQAESLVDGCSRNTGEITSQHEISGTFQVRKTAINRLDVRLWSLPNQQPAGALVLRVWRGNTRDTQIAEFHQDLRGVSDQQLLTFYFSPEKEAVGRDYSWEVAADGAGPTHVALCLDDMNRPAVSVYGADGAQVYAAEMNIFERWTPLPRAYVAYDVENVADDEQAADRLLDPAFDVRNTVITIGATGLPPQSAMPATIAQITRFQDTLVVVSVRAQASGILVLNDQYDPGWQVYVDGRAATSLRVNQIMRGVALPAGEHEVVFRFEPRSLRLGLGLTLSGLVVLLVLVCGDVAVSQRRRLDREGGNRS